MIFISHTAGFDAGKSKVHKMKKIMLLIGLLGTFNANAADVVDCATVRADDERLACYDETNPPKFVAKKAWELDAQETIDKAFAESLKNPDSVLEYALTPEFECTQLGQKKTEFTTCLCVKMNSKNSYGAYAGTEITYARLISFPDKTYMAMVGNKVPDAQLPVCANAGFVKREPSLISDALQ